VVKAAVRPMVLRIDPSFSKATFGFTTFSRLLAALKGVVIERVGIHDHEMAVRGDVADTADGAPPPVIVDESVPGRILRKKGDSPPQGS